MLAEQILRSSLNDVIFEGRNKSYGAYALRNFYERHLMWAMIIAFSVVLLSLTVPRILEKLYPPQIPDKPAITDKPITLPPPPRLEDRPELPVVVVEPPAQSQTLTDPVIVIDTDVPIDAPTLEVLINTTIDNPLTGVEGGNGTSVYPETGTGTFTEPGIIDAPAPDFVHLVVEETPEFPGGLGALNNFINRNIRYPEPARIAGVDGKVFISFVLNKEGEVTQVSVDKGLGFGLDEEAVRVVKLLRGFSPAKQGGHPVNYRYVLPIRFKLK